MAWDATHRANRFCRDRPPFFLLALRGSRRTGDGKEGLQQGRGGERGAKRAEEREIERGESGASTVLLCGGRGRGPSVRFDGRDVPSWNGGGGDFFRVTVLPLRADVGLGEKKSRCQCLITVLSWTANGYY
jgi:hypothetical protein